MLSDEQLVAVYNAPRMHTNMSGDRLTADLRAVAAAVRQSESEIYAHTNAGYLRIAVCPECSQRVQTERRSGEFVAHDISPFRAVCPGSGIIAQASDEEIRTTEGILEPPSPMLTKNVNSRTK